MNQQQRGHPEGTHGTVDLLGYLTPELHQYTSKQQQEADPRLLGWPQERVSWKDDEDPQVIQAAA